MIFTPSPIAGAYIIDPDFKSDHRGFFARMFCAETFEEHGLKLTVAQCNSSFSYKKGTIRGLHYQTPPAPEAKLIRCTQGAIYEVIVDVRIDSPTYLKHVGVELTAESRRMLYIPEMCAAGCQALTDEAEASYQVSSFYSPQYERGIRFDDPLLGIVWPLRVTELSEKDCSWPLLRTGHGEEAVYGAA